MQIAINFILLMATMSSQPGDAIQNRQAGGGEIIHLHHDYADELIDKGILLNPTANTEFGPNRVQSPPARRAITGGNLKLFKSIAAQEKSSIISYRGVNYGETLLHVAAAFNRKEFITYLVNELGFDVNIRDRNGATPAHYAVTSAGMNNNAALEMIALLKELGADLTLNDNENSSIVMDARDEKRSSEFVSKLIELIAR